MTIPVRRVGLIGDVHQEDRALESALEHLGAADLDLLLCTGDVADGAGDFVRCCHLLGQHRVQTVLGNHDRWLLSAAMRTLPDALPVQALQQTERSFLRSLPPTLEHHTVAGPLLLCHGVGTNDMAKLGPEDEGYALESNLELQRLLDEGRFRIVIGGHSHRRMVRAIGEIIFINAGTLKAEDHPCFALVDFEQRWVQFWDIQDRERLVKADNVELAPDR